MARICFLFVGGFLVALALGCDISPNIRKGKSSATPSNKESTATSLKTPDELRDYLQENIDRYLGGQKTDEQLNKLTRHFLVVSDAKLNGLDDITIVAVRQAFSESGEKMQNGFKAKLKFSGPGWTREDEIHFTYRDDRWEHF